MEHHLSIKIILFCIITYSPAYSMKRVVDIVKHGASLEIRDASGKIPYDHALTAKSSEEITLLLYYSLAFEYLNTYKKKLYAHFEDNRCPNLF